MLENIQGHSRGSIPPLRMPSPLPHDLCHEWNVSRRLPAVMYGCEIWTIKKAEHQRIDAFNCVAGEDS